MRVEFTGVGTPIPTEALPEPTLDATLPPMLFQWTADDEFDKTDYVGLGYTHFEAFCVGAVGGRGGDWESVDPLHHRISTSKGGGGGGGGFHRVGGLLEDLPDISDVIVGLAGINGSPVQRYPGHPSGYDPGTNGTDGGASSFDGTTCRASGGKGGQPTPVHGNNREVPGGHGGDGGIGGQTTAGGGATGYSGTGNGADGTWDGAIGKGGAGGRGGTYLAPDPEIEASDDYTYLASAGGQGSFSHLDTSVYGHRQYRSTDSLAGKSIVPGSGGGARPTTLLKFGSHAVGYSPNGVVVVRLTKIVP